MIALAGGVHRTVPITSATTARSTSAPEDAGTGDLLLSVEIERLRAAITDRTRLILVNTPHNPTGIMLPDEVLEAVVEELSRTTP